MNKFTIICRNRNVSIDGLHTTKLRVVTLNDALLESFLIYQIKRRHKGKTWHQENAQAITLLLEYWQATLGKFSSPRLMFEAFSNAVHYGTVTVDGSDLTELRWKPRTAAQANKLIKYITAYSDWLYIETGEESVLLNPHRKATQYEKILNLAAYHHRKNNSFLKHTYDDSKANKQAEYMRTIDKHKEPQTTAVTYKFPKEKTWEVIEKGFIIYGSRSIDPIHERLDLAKILAFMLMRFAGLRISEVLNIYVEDISVDPIRSDISLDKKMPLVKVHHPSQGFAPEQWCKKYNKTGARRAEYLKQQYGMNPRNDSNNPKCLYSGWKEPVLIRDKFYMIAYFNDSQAAEIFMIYWTLYLQHQPNKKKDHPFAFSNQKDGRPLSYKSLKDGLAAAVKRCGLISAKSEGTTPHGPRHLYKSELDERGLATLFIKSAMHHKNIHSQNSYGAPTHEEINARMIKAESKASTTKYKLNQLKDSM